MQRLKTKDSVTKLEESIALLQLKYDKVCLNIDKVLI